MMVGVAGGEIRLKNEGTHSSWVEVVGPYEIAARPTTVGLYSQVTEEVDAAMQESNLPVTEVSWLDAVRFCNRFSLSEGLEEVYLIDRDPDGLDVVCNMGAGGYRLPTEGEWELACRAGSSGVRYGVLDEIGWYAGNSAGRVHAVATKQPNDWGLYDAIGNVWEWCWDIFDADVYGPYRVFRGGGWNDQPRGCRASCRRKSHPSLKVDDLGFRIARTVV